MSDAPSTRRAANLFDLRRIIGGLFVFYGVLLAVLGLFDSQEEIDKAAGVNINLWAGLAMLAFGILMLVSALTRPLGDELVEGAESAEALASDQRGRGTRRDRDRTGGDGEAGPE